MIYRELLLGCGYRRDRLIDPYSCKNTQPSRFALEADRWRHVTTVDLNPSCRPDYVMDLERGLKTLSAGQSLEDDRALFKPDGPEWTFESNVFDEIHAYEVLEHLGQQGDVTSFFGDFDELWRVLRPGGFLCATVPSRYSSWLWGDPGHRRAILPETLCFLNRPHYHATLGAGPGSDYRSLFVSDWDILSSIDNRLQHAFVLQAVKPARVTKNQGEKS